MSGKLRCEIFCDSCLCKCLFRLRMMSEERSAAVTCSARFEMICLRMGEMVGETEKEEGREAAQNVDKTQVRRQRQLNDHTSTSSE